MKFDELVKGRKYRIFTGEPGFDKGEENKREYMFLGYFDTIWGGKYALFEEEKHGIKASFTSNTFPWSGLADKPLSKKEREALAMLETNRKIEQAKNEGWIYTAEEFGKCIGVTENRAYFLAYRKIVPAFFVNTVVYMFGPKSIAVYSSKLKDKDSDLYRLSFDDDDQPKKKAKSTDLFY